MSFSSFECLEQDEDSGKKSESFTKIIQGLKEDFTDFLQRLASAVNRIAPDSEVRQILIESLAFENANSECERVVRQDEAQ